MLVLGRLVLPVLDCLCCACRSLLDCASGQPGEPLRGQSVEPQRGELSGYSLEALQCHAGPVASWRAGTSMLRPDAPHYQRVGTEAASAAKQPREVPMT